MPYPIEEKLVIAVSSSALFNMLDSDAIFTTHGEEEYRKYQTKHIDTPFEKGVAFPFVQRLLSLNDSFPELLPVEVVLFSKNSPETGLRAFRSIEHYGSTSPEPASPPARATISTSRRSTPPSSSLPIEGMSRRPSVWAVPQGSSLPRRSSTKRTTTSSASLSTSTVSSPTTPQRRSTRATASRAIWITRNLLPTYLSPSARSGSCSSGSRSSKSLSVISTRETTPTGVSSRRPSSRHATHRRTSEW